MPGLLWSRLQKAVETTYRAQMEDDAVTAEKK